MLVTRFTSSAGHICARLPGHARLNARIAGGNVKLPVVRSSLARSSYYTTPSRASFSSSSQSHKEYANSQRLLCAAGISAVAISAFLAQPLLAEEAKATTGPPFTKEQIGVICIIGGPSSGKSTQLDNAAKRFNLIKLDAKKQNLNKEIETLVENAKSDDKTRVVIENFPRTLEAAQKFEKEVVPILLIISIVLDAPKGIARIEGDESLKRDAKINWKRFEDASEGLIKQFRLQGNILEITGEWPKDEVWEQVEAKLESALELDDRGEL